MPTIKTSHEGWMSKICGVCTLKPKYSQKINPVLLELIKRNHYENYDLESMPIIVCKSCVNILKEIDKEGPSAKKCLPAVDYSIFVLPKVTRSTENDCTCEWCRIGRLYGKAYSDYVESAKAKQGRPSLQDNKETEGAIKICKLCFGKVAKGVQHYCNKTNRNNNLGKIN